MDVSGVARVSALVGVERATRSRNRLMVRWAVHIPTSKGRGALCR